MIWPTPRFTDNGDGTVTDNLTGLIWLKDTVCPGGLKTWQQALDFVTNPLNSGGTACSGCAAGAFTDWRLPSVKELLSLVDYGESSPSLPLHPFTGVIVNFYWSSSSAVVFTPGEAWIVSMNDGASFNLEKGNINGVWPVRGGQ